MSAEVHVLRGQMIDRKYFNKSISTNSIFQIGENQEKLLGGLWEAGIKSAKKHLRRIMGKSIFNFEELSTVFCQIENVLNSMPIGLVSDDLKDEVILTPGHLISGSKLECYPTEPASQISDLKHFSNCSIDAYPKYPLSLLEPLEKRVCIDAPGKLNGQKRAPISRWAMLYMSWTTTRLPYNGPWLECHMCIVGQTILFVL